MEKATVIAGQKEDLYPELAELKSRVENMKTYTEAIIQTIHDPILIMDRALKIKHATLGFYNKFNTTNRAIEGKYFYELKNCYWNDTALYEKISRIALQKKSFEGHETICHHPDLGERLLSINARYLDSLPENLIILSIRDITPIQQEKNQLILNKNLLEEKITLTVEASDMGTWEMDTNTNIILWDDRCRQLFGINSAQLSYDEFLEALHPDDRSRISGIITGVLNGANDGKYNTEFRTRHEHENEMKWLKASGRVYFDKSGVAQRFAGTVLDITPQKQNEQLLRESEERFRLTADAAAAMIWLAGTNKMCNYFNKSWLQFTGRSFDQEKGNGWFEGLHEDDYHAHVDCFSKNFDARKKFHNEYRLRRRDGTYRWVSDSAVPRFSPEGIFEGYIGTCIDIHDQKMTRKELEQLVEDRTKSLSDAIGHLKTSNHNLEEFAYVASHDLQEPLRKIQTFASRLQEKKKEQLSPDTRLYLSKITKASNRMSRLIGDLLNYSKLQKTDEPFEPVNLNEIILEVLSDFDYVIQEKKVNIQLDKLPQVKGVPMRMNQLFHNLLSNAIKFSRPGISPVIHIYAQDLTGTAKEKYNSLRKDCAYTMITFADNGIGFNEEFTDKIFNIFQRLNGVDEYEGTGIGLAICRKIVINHEGIIFAESKENEGTHFKVILPLA